MLAYNIFSGTKSEYRYVAAEKTEAFALEKDFLLGVLDRFDSIRSRIFSE